MQMIPDVRPNELKHVYDLLIEVGVDVSDWPNYAGNNIKTNPKYCYKWSFIEPSTVAVFCLWYENMEELNGVIFQEKNLRVLAQQLAAPSNGRALQMDRDIHTAWSTNLPIRVIICDKNQNTNRATKRTLDPLPWSVDFYNEGTGQWRLVRGLESPRFADQFSIEEIEPIEGRRRDRTGTEPVRNSDVRQRALNRARGKCEYCETEGFSTVSGLIYLESHHIIPLSDGGEDIDGNVAALCPNHHRQAHHGFNRSEIREMLQSKIATTGAYFRR